MAKDTKERAGYRRAERPGVNCHECRYMNEDGTCERVEGIVKPNMVCDHWSPR